MTALVKLSIGSFDLIIVFNGFLHQFLSYSLFPTSTFSVSSFEYLTTIKKYIHSLHWLVTKLW